MPGVLDVFRSDAFGLTSLTTSINKLPYVPGRLGDMGLFQEVGIPTTTAVIEERYGKLALVGTAARNATNQALPEVKRVARSFVVPYIPYTASVLADDVQGVRSFGSESEVESVAARVNDKLAAMKQDIEVTKEFHRIGAIQGVTYDSDGTTVIYDWFHQFGITPKIVAIDFTSPTSIKGSAAAIIRYIGDSLGAQPVAEIHAFCGQKMFDKLMLAAEVRTAYDRYQEGMYLREQQVRSMFPYAGIMWEEYRGQVGAKKFIADDQIRIFPVGVPQLFQIIYAPAPFTETVNTVGIPFYAKQERQKFDTGIDLLACSAPLAICTRPGLLVECYDLAAGGS